MEKIKTLSIQTGSPPVQNLTFAGSDSKLEEEDCSSSAIDAFVDAIELDNTTRNTTPGPAGDLTASGPAVPMFRTPAPPGGGLPLAQGTPTCIQGYIMT